MKYMSTSISKDAACTGKAVAVSGKAAAPERSAFFRRALLLTGAVIMTGASLFWTPSASAQTQPTQYPDSASIAAEASRWAPIRLTANDESLKNCNNTLEQKKTANATPKEIARALFNRGSVFLGMERYNEAIADFNEAIRLDSTDGPDSTDARAYANRGYAYAALKNLEQARSDFEQALKLDPKLTKALIGLGNVMNELKLYKRALAAFDETLKLEPNNVQAHTGRADALFGLNLDKKALAAIDTAIAKTPQATMRGLFEDDVEPNPPLAKLYHLRSMVLAKLRRPAWQVNEARYKANQFDPVQYPLD